MLIKICGIKDPETAYFAAIHGANMIGIVRYPHSKRYVELPLAREIAAAAIEGGSVPVIIFKDATRDEVITTCEPLGITTVQLHGAVSELPKTYVRIVANGTPAQIDPKTEFLLFDNVIPGSGIPFDWKTFSPPQGVRWFLSGGLTPHNVLEGIRLLHPTGVDVSSGVERNEIKTHDLIEQFIEKVRKYE